MRQHHYLLLTLAALLLLTGWARTSRPRSGVTTTVAGNREKAAVTVTPRRVIKLPERLEALVGDEKQLVAICEHSARWVSADGTVLATVKVAADELISGWSRDGRWLLVGGPTGNKADRYVAANIRLVELGGRRRSRDLGSLSEDSAIIVSDTGQSVITWNGSPYLRRQGHHDRVLMKWVRSTWQSSAIAFAPKGNSIAIVTTGAKANELIVRVFDGSGDAKWQCNLKGAPRISPHQIELAADAKSAALTWYEGMEKAPAAGAAVVAQGRVLWRDKHPLAAPCLWIAPRGGLVVYSYGSASPITIVRLSDGKVIRQYPTGSLPGQPTSAVCSTGAGRTLIALGRPPKEVRSIGFHYTRRVILLDGDGNELWRKDLAGTEYDRGHFKTLIWLSADGRSLAIGTPKTLSVYHIR